MPPFLIQRQGFQLKISTIGEAAALEAVGILNNSELIAWANHMLINGHYSQGLDALDDTPETLPAQAHELFKQAVKELQVQEFSPHDAAFTAARVIIQQIADQEVDPEVGCQFLCHHFSLGSPQKGPASNFSEELGMREFVYLEHEMCHARAALQHPVPYDPGPPEVIKQEILSEAQRWLNANT
ncbi:hypothetical protein [Kordiimonas lacus]|uniref:Uncharacterized protein n=1 Tax=Kordiimonas lacus TaxID=637679 RepID=A0A1G6VJ74_9PROT|nr:hypothetical protein [Kordiimonas lacus]SDD53561.1 hypothetical protein SAMN04488071_0745 [Kordiimonas lacus]